MGEDCGKVESVFLSYARANAGAVDALEHELQGLQVKVWRDQESLYSGQRWPKALGEAIAASDAVVLIWSSEAAQSDFVELEWTTALALKKPLLLWQLDQAPLPAALRSIHAIDARAPQDVAHHLQGALRATKPPQDAASTQAVLTELGKIDTRDAKRAIEAARTVFQQHGMTVQGTVYQAGGDIHINVPAPPAPSRAWPERWQVWVGIVVGILTAVILIKDRGHIDNTPEAPLPAVEQILAGFVYGEGNRPLEAVTLALPAFQLSQTTDRNGYYRFVVKVAEQQPAVLTADKPGYEHYETHATLGNPNQNFTLSRRK